MILNEQRVSFFVDECLDERHDITTRSVLYQEDNTVAAYVKVGRNSFKLKW